MPASLMTFDYFSISDDTSARISSGVLPDARAHRRAFGRRDFSARRPTI